MKKMLYRVKFYTTEGHFAYEEYSNDFTRLLFLAYQDRKNRPTIWVYDNETAEYIRVHDFNFGVFSQENVEKYLSERILNSDTLLSNVSITW